MDPNDLMPTHLSQLLANYVGANLCPSVPDLQKFHQAQTKTLQNLPESAMYGQNANTDGH